MFRNSHPIFCPFNFMCFHRIAQTHTHAHSQKEKEKVLPHGKLRFFVMIWSDKFLGALRHWNCLDNRKNVGVIFAALANARINILVVLFLVLADRKTGCLMMCDENDSFWLARNVKPYLHWIDIRSTGFSVCCENQMVSLRGETRNSSTVFWYISQTSLEIVDKTWCI